MRGRICYLEGPDGVGKSEIARRILESPDPRWAAVGVSREPTAGMFGYLAREESDPFTASLLFAMDRLQNMHRWGPEIDEGKNVLIDRGPMSMAIHQGIVDGVTGESHGLYQFDVIDALNCEVMWGQPIPSTIVLHAPQHVCEARVAQRGEIVTGDPLERQRAVWAVYDQLRSGGRPWSARPIGHPVDGFQRWAISSWFVYTGPIYFISADRPMEEVMGEVEKVLEIIWRGVGND